jgi:hypothetical protein
MERLDASSPRPARSFLAITFTVVLSVALFLLGTGLVLIAVGDHLAFNAELAAGPAGYSPVAGFYRDLEQRGLEVCWLAAPVGLIAAVIFLAWLYQAWSAVPPRHRDLRPALAVGLLLVPLFNVYWMFRAIPGLSSALRRALGERDVVRLSNTTYRLGVATCVLAFVPVLTLTSPFFLLVWVWRADREAQRLIERECPAERDAR